MEMEILLEGSDGSLCVNGDVLLYFYPAGDCDSIPWPLISEFRLEIKLREQLASALFDAREMGIIPLFAQSVLLPDGTRFCIDENLNLS